MQEQQRQKYLDTLHIENTAIIQTIKEINEEADQYAASVGDKTPRIKKILMESEALQACGFQPEFAAQVLFQCHSFGNFVVLRAGSPPAYDDPAIPKSMLNKTKTSCHGLLAPYLAVNKIFGRLEGTKSNQSIVKGSPHTLVSWEEPLQEARAAPNTSLTSKPAVAAAASTQSADAASPRTFSKFNWSNIQLVPADADSDSELSYEPSQRYENTLTSKKLDTKDAISLEWDPFDTAKYQHKTILKIRLIDILNQLDESGELVVAGYENGLLFLKNRPNVAHRKASGMFVIDFLQKMEPDELPRIFSRRWNHPINHKLWDPEKKVLAKIKALQAIPNNLYIRANSLRFNIYYTAHPYFDADIVKAARGVPPQERAKPPAIPGLEGVFVFAHLPKTYKEIYRALEINKYLPDDAAKMIASQDVNGTAEITSLLEACFKRDKDTSRLLEFFDSIARPITGDCDGLVVGQNINIAEIITFLRESGIVLSESAVPAADNVVLNFEFTYREYTTSITKMLTVYGTLSDTAVPFDSVSNEQKDFLHASNVYLHYQKWRCFHRGLPFPEDIEISAEHINHFGIATPHDLVFNLLSNHYYEDKLLSFYGNNSYHDKKILPLLTECFKKALSQMTDHGISHSEAVCVAMLELKASVAIRIKTTAEQAHQEQKEERTDEQQDQMFLGYHQHILENYFAYHLVAARLFKAKKINTGELMDEYVLPHPDYDNNVQHLFQHAYDMRNPGNLNINGPWLMVTAGGFILYGETQEQLVKILLSGNGCLLKNSFIDISHKVDMQIWGKVIAKQLEFGQPVSQKTSNVYMAFLHGPGQSEIKADTAEGFSERFFKPRQATHLASASKLFITMAAQD